MGRSMSGRDRRRPPGHSRDSPSSGVGKTCAECKKYSRKTFYCAKNQQVLYEGKEACGFFGPRTAPSGRRARKF